MHAEEAVDLHLHDGDHACILFSSDDEHRIVVGQFLAEGLRTRQRVLNLVGGHSPDTMRAYLRQAGADPVTSEAMGQLTIRKAEEAYLPDGTFDPDAMIGMLTATVAKALEAGWNGMRGSGDMAWALGGAPGSSRMMEYEAKLNHVIPGSRFRALCQYDMRKFPADTLLQVLTTHPIAFVGTERLDNFYYMPPEEYLVEGRPEAQLQRWLANLRERQTTEERRRAEILQKERLERFRKELEAKKSFLNMAAHELSTPLTPLGLQVKVLQRSDPATPLGAHQGNIAIIGRGYERMRSIVNQLLVAARAESAPLHNGKPADLSRIVRESMEAFLAPAQGKQVSIEADLPESAPAQVDAEQVGQVLDNLLSNATKFTPPQGRIAVRLAPHSGGWTVIVADTGVGLSEEQAQRLFQPFARLHDPRIASEGNGLGLHISRSIVERHGGTIWARSPGQGQGSEFGFWIPAGAPADSTVLNEQPGQVPH